MKFISLYHKIIKYQNFMKTLQKIFLLILLIFSSNIIEASNGILYKRPPNKPLLRLNDFNFQRFLDETPDNIQRLNALKREELEYKKINSNVFQSEIAEWKNIGPYDISGRVRAIAIDPQNSNIVYIGAAAGGIWKTTNSGQSWKAIFDFENASSFGALCIDPNNSSIIYAATGEMVIGGGIPYFGNGIYKSSDAGDTWFQIGLTEVAAFAKIYVHPQNSNLIYTAGAIRNGGVYKSTNAGVSWEKMYDGNITDISINPKNINEIYAGANTIGVIYSYDGGKSWDLRSVGLNELAGRVSVQGFSEDFGIVYTLFERKNTTGAIYKSTNYGKNWFLVLNGNNSFFNEQGYYNNFISISDKNSNIVLAGGIDLWRTSNGGQNWNIVNENTVPTRMHVDQHCASFSASENNKVYVGNDGGVFLSTDEGVSWKNINKGLMITQFYSMNLDLKQKNRNFGGTQDNGTLGTISNSWKMLVGGDGFDCFLHPNDPDVLFGEIYYGAVFKYYISNDNFKFLKNGLPDDDVGVWHSPFVFDEKNHTMYLGRKSLYASYNYGEVFFQLTPRSNHYFTAIEPSKKNSRIIYAGNQVGEIIVSKDLGITWNKVESEILPSKYIKDISTSKFNDSIVYVAYSGYNNKHIFKSTNMGKSWLQIDGNLPNIPVNSIILHPENESVIFAGTDIGVYVSYNDGKDWSIYGKNLPRTPITDFKFHTNRLFFPTLTLRAASYGRSIWEIEVPEKIISEPMIVSPAGGEIYTGTELVKISWYGFEYPIRIELSTDGANYFLIKDSIYNNKLNIEIPDVFTYSARIKIISYKNGDKKISNTFSIIPKKKGSLLAEFSVGFNPYGIAINEKDNIWIVDYRKSEILLFDLNTFSLIKKINLPVKGLYTDIVLSKNLDTIYLHKMESEDGFGAEIIVIDTSQNLIKRIKSPTKYPMGLAIIDDNLYISDRDSNQKIYKMNVNTYQITEIMSNPVSEPLAPRCLAYNNELLHQITTNFKSNVLSNSEITVFDYKNASIREKINLTNRLGAINARGIDIDKKDGNYWVSDFIGNIYKIASGNSTTDIESIDNMIEYNIYPNPVKNIFRLFLNNNEKTDNPMIYNVLGVKQNINYKAVSDNIFEFDASNLENGVYFIVINNQLLKFIKI